MKKNYIGFARDHSGSMQFLSNAAMKDYNSTIASIREAATTNQQDTIISVVKFGVEDDGGIAHETVNSSIQSLKPIDFYETHGMTPLFDAVGELIELFEKVPDADNPDVSFLIMVTTDGAENASKSWLPYRLKEKMAQLQATDRWSFVFRVPYGYAHHLTSLGIPEGNILEWEVSEVGMAQSQVATGVAINRYYNLRTEGCSSTQAFYEQRTDDNTTKPTNSA